MSSQATQAVFDPRQPADSARRHVDGPVIKVGRVFPIFEEKYCNDSALRDVLLHRFSFNGESYDLGEKIEWLANPSIDTEWQILLHKFYYAPGLARKYRESDDERYRLCFEELVSGWIAQSPVNFIASDVTARRIQNWIYALSLFWQHDPQCFSQDFQNKVLGSLRMQVDAVCANLARARNHRTLELYAIFLASVAVPEMDLGNRWRTLSISEMIANIDSDLLSDGVHCELSTDYHHIVLRSYLLFYRLAKLHKISLPNSIGKKLCLALDFSMHIHRPDGEIPALSDSDSRSFLELLRWGSQAFGRQDYAFVASQGAMGVPPSVQHKAFVDGGYALLRSPWRNGERFADARYLVFDCGPIGDGNHGHLDALNVELAAFGRPLVVDPGRYTYDEQGSYNWRAHFRQTAAHNTVTINNLDQAIYRQRGPKRKIQNPKPICSLVESELYEDMAYLHGRVTSANYEAQHNRHIWFVDNRYWVVLDRMCAASVHQYELRYQLTAEACGRSHFNLHQHATEIISPGLTLLIAQDAPTVTEEQAFVSKEYGAKEAAPRICASASASNYNFITILYPTLSSAPRFAVEGTNISPKLEVNMRDWRDSWEWNNASQVMTYRDRESVQTWRLRGDPANG